MAATDTPAQEEEEAILASIERFLERDVKPHVHKLEHDDVYPAEIVERMQELGLFGATIAADYGGLGLKTTVYAGIVERISRVWMSLCGIFNSHLIMSAAVERFGTEAQKRAFLPRFAAGELRGGLALTEPDCGTDLQAIRTVARREGDHYVVNGTKTWISNGIYGHCFALLVKTEPDAEPRHKGMSLFLAEKGEGFTVGRKLEKLGYKGIDSAELVFQDYRIPADRLIGGIEGLRSQACARRARARPHQRGGARRRLGAGGPRSGRRLQPGAQDLRQADLPASGHPAQARGHGDRGAGGTPLDL